MYLSAETTLNKLPHRFDPALSQRNPRYALKGQPQGWTTTRPYVYRYPIYGTTGPLRKIAHLGVNVKPDACTPATPAADTSAIEYTRMPEQPLAY
jgi:hypothetical protein